MPLMRELFLTPVGLFSAAVMLLMLGMGVFFLWLFTQNDAPEPTEPPPEAK